MRSLLPQGVIGWGDDGTGFILQVTTPDWPGAGSKAHPRKSDGNTLGCCDDDNSKALELYLLSFGCLRDLRRWAVSNSFPGL